MSKISLPLYIAHRLAQHNCHHLHAVPGDFFLPFLTKIAAIDSPVRYIGNTNELNAAYAADGYARINGLGAVCTTYGVGELSALNAIAGSYAERVPVISIVGTPRRSLTRKWEDSGWKKGLVHHMPGLGHSSKVFSDIVERFVCSKLELDDPEQATYSFDELLKQCLRQRRPGYVAIPSDLDELEVDRNPLEERLQLDTGTKRRRTTEVEELRSRLLQAISTAAKPLILVDQQVPRFGLTSIINEVVSTTGIPTVVTQGGVGIVDSHHPSFLGLNAGSFSPPDLKTYINSADLVLIFGPSLSDTNTAGWTAVPPTPNTFTFHGNEIEHLETLISCDCEAFLTSILPELSTSHIQIAEEIKSQLPPRSVAATLDITNETTLTQDLFYPLLSPLFRTGDTLLLANGTPLLGAPLLTLPPRVDVIASGLWFSVGQMLPAAQGAALAKTVQPKSSNHQTQKQSRTILLEGDGSFQATANSLSDIIRYRLPLIIFILNNEGYAYERLIEGETAEYNDIGRWDYLQAPWLMGGKEAVKDGYEIHTFTVETVGHLKDVLKQECVEHGRGLVLVDVKMGRTDVPMYFREALKGAGRRLRE